MRACTRTAVTPRGHPTPHPPPPGNIHTCCCRQVKLLPPGVYQYKFIVDGQWKYAPDQKADYDEMGNVNNTLEARGCRWCASVCVRVRVARLCVACVCVCVCVCVCICARAAAA